jgi:uncharacterized pyridoxal phosphate-containing UPF0001 family protein
MIGHLQTNKAKKAARVFDMVETVGSTKACPGARQGLRENEQDHADLNRDQQRRGGAEGRVMPEEATALIRK